MSQRAVDFVHMWISANVHPKDFIYERYDSKSKEYAVEYRKHAAAVGIFTGRNEEELRRFGNCYGKRHSEIS